MIVGSPCPYDCNNKSPFTGYCNTTACINPNYNGSGTYVLKTCEYCKTMIIKTAIKPEEDLDLLCNSLNAQAGRFSYSDPALCNYLLRAQAAINSLCEMLLKEQQEIVRCKDCKMNNQCSIQFKFANADNPGDWFCADGKQIE